MSSLFSCLLTDCLQQEVKSPAAAAAAAEPGSLQHTLEERVVMYRTALKNAKSAGETSKSRRYDRGLKVGQLIWIKA